VADEPLISREELSATLFAIADIREDVREIRRWLRGKTMAKRRKMTPEELEERLKREREFRELLDRRRALDQKLAAEREHRRGS